MQFMKKVMRRITILLGITSLVMCLKRNNTMNESTRKEKLLSLFSIVNFPNEECTSSTGDNGTCLTAPECSARSGVVSGTCASGFGGCCLLYNRLCGGTLEYNNTYILNPGYSDYYTTSGTCEWTVTKSRTDICFIRFDFDELTTAAPDSTTTASLGKCTTDYFQGTNAKTGTNMASGKTTPLICGVNDGSHIYVDAGADTSSEAVLTAVFTGTNNRKWKIKVSQVICDGRTNPPGGCLQYHTGTTGTVRSFNFLAASGSYLHLADQYYKVCIRRESGYCKIGWYASTDTDSFKLSRPSTNYKSASGYVGCISDAVKIYGGSNYGQVGSCCTPASPACISQYTVDRYCGGTLNCYPGSESKNVIISSRQPFELEVEFSATEQAGTNNRGFCLNYYQILC